MPQLRVWGSRPTPFKFTELTEFAGVFRYSTPREFTSTERDQIRETVRILREFVNTRLKTTQRLTPSKRDSAPNRACQPPPISQLPQSKENRLKETWHTSYVQPAILKKDRRNKQEVIFIFFIRVHPRLSVVVFVLKC